MGHLEIVKYLIEEQGCDPHSGGEFSLMEACEKDHLDIVKYLIEEQGCDPHILDDLFLRIATKYQYADIVDYLNNLDNKQE